MLAPDSDDYKYFSIKEALSVYFLLGVQAKCLYLASKGPSMATDSGCCEE